MRPGGRPRLRGVRVGLAAVGVVVGHVLQLRAAVAGIEGGTVGLRNGSYPVILPIASYEPTSACREHCLI